MLWYDVAPFLKAHKRQCLKLVDRFNKLRFGGMALKELLNEHQIRALPRNAHTGSKDIESGALVASFLAAFRWIKSVGI
jgi:hypothetical protein